MLGLLAEDLVAELRVQRERLAGLRAGEQLEPAGLRIGVLERAHQCAADPATLPAVVDGEPADLDDAVGSLLGADRADDAPCVEGDEEPEARVVEALEVDQRSRAAEADGRRGMSSAAATRANASPAGPRRTSGRSRARGDDDGRAAPVGALCRRCRSCRPFYESEAAPREGARPRAGW